MAEWKFGTIISRDLALGPILIMVIASPLDDVFVQEGHFTVVPGEWIAFPLTDNGQTHDSFYPKFRTSWLEMKGTNTEVEPTIP